MLNNQPMGFYQPATLVKDAQRHGLKIRPIDVTCSDWLCALEKVSPSAASTQKKSDAQPLALRMGLRYVKGLRAAVAEEIVRQRALQPFTSIHDLKLRVSALQKSELAALAGIGALNFIAGRRTHRRDALWQVERAARPAGPLLERSDAAVKAPAVPVSGESPLKQMTMEERLVADFRGTGLTVGPHPMAGHRAEMKKQGIRSAIELAYLPDGVPVRVAGAVIARQRPGTAKGFVFQPGR